MTTDPDFHKLELAMERVEGEIKALRAELGPRFLNVEERIVHQGNELRLMVTAVADEAKRAHLVIAAEVVDRRGAIDAEVRERGRVEQRVEHLEEWKSKIGDGVPSRLKTLEDWKTGLGDDLVGVIQYVRDSKAQLRTWRAFGAVATTIIVALCIALLTKGLRLG